MCESGASRIQNAPVICNHCPGEGWGIAGLKCEAIFEFPRRSAGEMTGFDITILTPGRFSIAKGGTNEFTDIREKSW